VELRLHWQPVLLPNKIVELFGYESPESSGPARVLTVTQRCADCQLCREFHTLENIDDVNFLSVRCRIHQKGTKNALETGRTFATLFADMDLRLRLLGARTEDEFKQLMWEHMKELADEQCDGNARRKLSDDSAADKIDEPPQTSAVSHTRTRDVLL
jgi:hypothetical protein